MKIYLASPYSHKDKDVRSGRFLCACEAAARIIRTAGHIVFSPIAHSHPISKYLDNSNDSSFWVALDLSFIDWCDELWVLRIDGWEDSTGIQREIDYAESLGKKVDYI